MFSKTLQDENFMVAEELYDGRQEIDTMAFCIFFVSSTRSLCVHIYTCSPYLNYSAD